MGWLRFVSFSNLQVSFAECSLFYWALLQKKTYHFKEPTNRNHPISLRWYLSDDIWKSLRIVAHSVTDCLPVSRQAFTHVNACLETIYYSHTCEPWHYIPITHMWTPALKLDTIHTHVSLDTIYQSHTCERLPWNYILFTHMWALTLYTNHTHVKACLETRYYSHTCEPWNYVPFTHMWALKLYTIHTHVSLDTIYQSHTCESLPWN